MCQTWHCRTQCTKRQLQSLLGSLLFVSKCISISRFFLNCLLDILCTMHDKNKVSLSSEAQRNINWFQKFGPLSMGSQVLTIGLGARWGFQGFAFQLPLGYLNYNIAHPVMLNILVALRVWNHCCSKSRICITCDNEAV